MGKGGVREWRRAGVVSCARARRAARRSPLSKSGPQRARSCSRARSPPLAASALMPSANPRIACKTLPPSHRGGRTGGPAGPAAPKTGLMRRGREEEEKKKGGGRESGRPLPRPCSLARLLVGQDRRAIDVQDGRSPPTQPVARLGRQRRGGRGGDGAPSCGRYLPPRERGRERAHSPHVSPSLRLSLTLPPQTANHAPSHGTGRGRPRWRPRRWRTGRLWSTAEPGGGRRKKRQRCY